MQLRSRDLYVPCAPGERHCHSFVQRDSELEAVEPCELDASGGYGNTQNAADSVNVAFIYQVQTTAELSAETLEDEGLKVLEDALSTFLLSRIFDECPHIDRATGVLSLDLPAIIQIHGVESAPRDFFLNGDEAFNCRTDLLPDATGCYLAGGNFTIYGNELVEWARLPALNATEGIMDAGLLNDIYSGAIDVRFVEIVNDPNDPRFKGNEPAENPNGNDDDINEIIGTQDSDKMKAWPWAVAGALSLLLVAGVVARRRSKNAASPDTPAS